MDAFIDHWGEAALTSLSFFWKALWAFVLGYLVSSMIQVFVSEQRMRQTMGDAGPRSIALGSFFGFISSSCSFAALSTTRALFQKGAGLVPALAFLLASTNLVIELGFIIAIFLGWQFVVGEYLGGVLLILFTWLIVRLTLRRSWEEAARERVEGAAGDDDDEVPDWRKLLRTREGWTRVAKKFVMEWQMVWKDVLIGFTVAGLIAAFVPREFFQWLFVGSGSENPALWEVGLQALIGPLAAFATFIGSMGNIPLAAVLYDNGVSFAGVMAFIFSDLVVLPVLRIQAQYYGWRMALYILGVFLLALLAAAMLMHLGFSALDLLPEKSGGNGQQQADSAFKIDYSFFLNLVALLLSAALTWLYWRGRGDEHEHDHGDSGASPLRWVMPGLCGLAVLWLVGGCLIRVLGP